MRLEGRQLSARGDPGDDVRRPAGRVSCDGCGVHSAASRRPGPKHPQLAIPALLFRTRLAADPDGCFVAASARDPTGVTGVVFSVARGTLGWLGPLAVHPGASDAGPAGGSGPHAWTAGTGAGSA